LKLSSTVLGNKLLNFRVTKKGSTPNSSQLLRDQDPARYLIIILMETIKQLRAFVEVVERGNFTAAAKELNLTQPAVTYWEARRDEPGPESTLQHAG
jgi:hypothetical protein